MLVLTFLDMIIELFVGHWFHSTTLVADGCHMISDALTFAVSLACIRFSTRTSPRNTFGWVRLEVLGALANGIFLVALCFSLLLDAMTHFFAEEAISDPLTVLIVGAIGLIVNVIGIVLLHGHAHGHSHGHSHSRDNKLNLNAVEYSKLQQPGSGEDALVLKMKKDMGVGGMFKQG
ncbi:cation efflux family protein [Aphelenchoides avenae]|nr:cation efflux family protein [Aphelenchus avenae]